MNSNSLVSPRRIASIDIIRGFALMGIFFVNVPSLFIPDPLYVFHYEGIDRFIRLIYDLFIQTKFYTIFAFLFGVSAYYFMKSVERRGLSPAKYFSKRLAWMFLFGVIHMTLLWFGDILHTYAFIGFFLLLFYKREAKTLIKWAVGLFILAILLQLSSAFAPANNTTEITPFFTAYTNTNGEINYFIHFIDQLKERWNFFLWMMPVEIIANPIEFIPLFLAGMATAKMGVFTETAKYIKGIKRIQLISLLCSIPFLLLMIQEYIHGEPASYLLIYLSGKLLATFYICTLLRILQVKTWQKRLSILAPFGKMAFTNYIAQTIISLLIVSLVIKDTGNIPLWIQLIYVIIILAIQLVVSKWVLSKWKYGPLEYVWRVLTYGRKNLSIKTTSKQM
ncbi:MAG: DUF418 domain-containing protein [Bacillaceae bacterium]